MTDQINEFDQIFRDRLSDQVATPPPAVWENIQAKRTFGHVVANRVSNNWGIFGTLLMLLLAGGSSVVLFGEEEIGEYTFRISEINSDRTIQIESSNAYQQKELNDSEIELHLLDYLITNESTIERVKSQNEKELDNEFYPSLDELAALAGAGFARPQLPNSKLSAYIENLEGWESARPKSFTRYYQMNLMAKQQANRSIQLGSPQKIDIDFDYVLPRVERKTFQQRSSLVFALTPHSIHKSMRAKYNLSSSFLRDREKAENTRMAYSVSGMLHYELTKYRFIETGINYTQIYEEMSFEGKRRFSNQYNFVEIPLLLGYQNRNARWGWHVKGGLGLQVLNTYKGYILKRVDVFGGVQADPLTRMNKNTVKNYINQNHELSNRQSKNELANLENAEENPFKTKGVVNLHLAAGLTYFHNEKMSFLITPSFRRSVNSITKEEARFTEKLQYMGISFGTRVKF